MSDTRIFMVTKVSDDGFTLTIEEGFGSDPVTVTVDKRQLPLKKGHVRYIAIKKPQKDKKDDVSGR